MLIRRYMGYASMPDHPGTWAPQTMDGHKTARMSCPLCGTVASLADHAIKAEGEVHPSVKCAKPSCTFHTYITLEGWSE